MKNVISQSLGLDLVNINVYATVYQNIPLSLRDRAIFTFSEFGARPMINVILQFLELDLVNINVSAKFYQNIPNGLRVKFHCFQNLNLGKTSTNPKCHLIISWATSCQYQCVCKISSQYSTQFKSEGHFHFFRIWSSAKPRLMKNVISQSLGLDLVNINVYAKVYQNIPLSSRDRAIFTFSEFEPRQRFGQSQVTFDNLLGYILSISLRMQNFIKIFQTVQELSTSFIFSEFKPRQRLGQSQMTFDNLLGYILSISLRMQNFIKIFQTV